MPIFRVALAQLVREQAFINVAAKDKETVEAALKEISESDHGDDWEEDANWGVEAGEHQVVGEITDVPDGTVDGSVAWAKRHRPKFYIDDEGSVCPWPTDVTKLTEDDRRAIYRHGQYAFPPPPVGPGGWNETDWITYICIDGVWIP